MTRVLLVRHGQASFNTDNYDRLSPLGEEQSSHVGSHLYRLGHRPDGLYSGALERQRETARLAALGLNGSGATDGGHTTIPALDVFNEYDADAIFNAYLDEVLSADPELAGRRDETRSDRRVFQRAFEGVMGAWLEDDSPEGRGVESWRTFQERIRAGFDDLRNRHGRGHTVALFTSGGVIASGVGAALGLPPAETMALNWRIYNASVSEIRFGRRGWTLMGFNSIDHLLLQDPERLVTFR